MKRDDPELHLQFHVAALLGITVTELRQRVPLWELPYWAALLPELRGQG